jgi:methionine synthase / methylenetetrahydrofolate reductase(NADPH)
MRPALQLLKEQLILADGAMGTYYSQISGQDTTGCEQANLEHPDLIRRIHREYLAAGAQLIRTNTFAAAAVCSSDALQLAAVCSAGYALAAECAGSAAFVAADIGPVYNQDPAAVQKALQQVVDAFLAQSADLFMFETFADPAELLPFCRYIRTQRPDAVIIASFALAADGFTRKGISLKSLAAAMESETSIDIWGLNCGIGPAHMARLAQKLAPVGKPLSFLPNSGYPRLENQRLVYGSTPDYFAQASQELAGSRVRLLGGCCGTTPQHLAALQAQLGNPKQTSHPFPAALPTPAEVEPARPTVRNPFQEKLAAGTFVIACELDPPKDSNLHPLIKAAHQLRLAGVDLLTLADSPLARVKLDPVSCAARLGRETGLPTLPHLCCRDRNVNSLRATLLAAHSEGIRQVLAVTGDAIPESERGFVKPVFNLNSVGLLQLIRQMNEELFAAEPLLAAAALDPGVVNPSAELARCLRKQEQGATVLFTQPIYSGAGLPLIREVRAQGLKVLIGLMPLLNYRNARYMSEEVPGCRIPHDILDRFNPDMDKETANETGLALACEIAASVRNEADGFYLIAPFNRADLISKLLDRLRDRNLL